MTDVDAVQTLVWAEYHGSLDGEGNVDHSIHIKAVFRVPSDNFYNIGCERIATLLNTSSERTPEFRYSKLYEATCAFRGNVTWLQVRDAIASRNDIILSTARFYEKEVILPVS